jgi:phosphoribosylformylglycinamidine synthase
VLDLAAERALQSLLVTLAGARLLRSAHDCSDGGIAVAVAECCFDTGGVGATLSLDTVTAARDPHINTAAALFGESASRAIVSIASDVVTEVLERAASAGVAARVIGETGGNRLRISVGGAVALDESLDAAERVWSTAIDQYFAKRVA